MYELPHKLPNDLTLRKLVNYKKISEMLGFDGKYSADHAKVSLTLSLISRKKSAVKHSTLVSSNCPQPLVLFGISEKLLFFIYKPTTFDFVKSLP